MKTYIFNFKVIFSIFHFLFFHQSYATLIIIYLPLYNKDRKIFDLRYEYVVLFA